MNPKECIFCKGSGMSKEHFWPDWLRHHFKTSPQDKHTGGLLSSDSKAPATLEKSKERPGNLITKKFRVVCTECNNGWMSQLEGKVKPILLSTIEKKNITLDESTIYELAQWIVMKVIVAEHSEDGTQLTPGSDRFSFYKDGDIPDYYRVYIAKHDTGHNSAYLRTSLTLSLSEKGPLTNLEDMKRNTQTVSFLLGPLCVYVIACREESYQIWSHFKLNQFRCIFPNKKNTLEIKRLKVINQKRLADLANALSDLAASPTVKHLGPLPL